MAAMAKGTWAGELHRLAMTDLIRDRAGWRGARTRGRSATCAIAWRLAEKYAPMTAQYIVSASSRRVPRMPKDLETKIGCPAGSGAAFERVVAGWSTQLSLFAQGDSALPPGVTGDYEWYGPALESAYNGAYYPSQVRTRTNAVVAQAAANGLGQPDLEYLAAIGGISISSADQWYDYEQSGGFGDERRPLSLFRAMNKWGRVGVADLGGAMMGSRGGFWWAVAGGLVASSVYAINS
jgi:hypothetical protein